MCITFALVWIKLQLPFCGLSRPLLSESKPFWRAAASLIHDILVHITNHLVIENHISLIQICLTPSVESTPGFFPPASPVMSRLTSSFTCQLISIIITTLIIHHSFTLSLQAQNLPFQQILPTLDFFYLPDCLHDNGTGHFSLLLVNMFLSLVAWYNL